MVTGVPIARQRKEAGRRFTMQADAAVRARDRMDKSFVEPIGGFELAPVRHRITRIRLADRGACF